MEEKNKEILICEICGITNESNIAFVKKGKFKMTLCNKHYRQLLYNNEISDPTPQLRNQFERNEYILYEDYAEICLYNMHGCEVARAIIDIEDVEKCKEYKWRHERTYVVTSHKRKNIYLHRFLKQPSDFKVVDHIDRNPLNNRKSNLRICSLQANMLNKSKNSRNKSGVTGVFWHKGMKRWWATIKYKYINYDLGYFDSIEEATKVRREAELKYFGEFAPKHTYK